MSTIGTLVTDFFEDSEYVKPVNAFKRAGHVVINIGLQAKQKVKGKKSSEIRKIVCNLGADSSCTNVFTRENIVIL